MRTFSAGTTGGRAGHAVRARDLTGFRLAWLQATHRAGWAGALWSCLAATVTLAALLPLVGAVAVTTALAVTLTRDGVVTVEQQVAGVDELAAFQREVDGRIESRMGPELVPLTANVAAGPFSAATLNGEPSPARLSGRQLMATWVDHLSGHVEVLAGELPPDGLGGGETAVTMAQSSADQLGLHLSDRVCFDFAASPPQPRWCARVVGLWQPLDARDPFWVSGPTGLILAMGRFDFFALARQQSKGLVAGVRYWANPEAVDADNAQAVAGRLSTLAGELAAPGRRVTTRLDGSLESFYDGQRLVTSTVLSFSAAVALLGISVVALIAARFVEGQAHELGLLRVRGWSRWQVWQVAFAGLGVLLLTGVPAALGACLLALAGMRLEGMPALDLRPSRLVLPLAVAMATLVVLVGALAAVAARAVWPDGESSQTGLRRRPRTWWARLRPWRRTAVALGLALLGLSALVAPRLAAAGQLTPVDALRWGLLLAPVAGLFLFTAAAVRLRELVARVPRPRDVSGALAGWQLERRPGQHAGAAFVLMLATATTTFAAFALTAELAEPAPAEPVLRQGLVVALVLGGLAAPALAVIGFGLHFRWAAVRRRREYGGLFAHGLAPAQVARSLAVEQAVTVVSSLVAGVVLGVAFALASRPGAQPAPAIAGLSVLAAAVPAACLLGGALAAGWLVRRMPDRVDLLRRGQP